MSRKVVVDISEGVDSSVATWLLKEQSYDMTGMTIQIWQDEDAEVQGTEDGCCGLSTMDGAKGVAMDLGIPYYIMNFKEEFYKNVVDYFAGKYVEGRTPNLCIACNCHVKWESLLKQNMAIGADCIATGHYAQIDSLPGGRYSLKTSVTAAKDQTYTLYNLTQEQLSHTLMPMRNYYKEEVQDMAERLGFPVAHKLDSQEICSAPNHDYASFVEEYTDRKLPPGNFVDLDGNVLDRRRGITHYTMGQRKGLNLSMGCPVFMVEMRPETNRAATDDNQDVFTNVLRCDKLNWMVVDGLHEKPMDVLAKIGYSHKGGLYTIREIRCDMVECRFHEPVRVVTPGQAVTLYDGDYVAGGGAVIGRNGR